MESEQEGHLVDGKKEILLQKRLKAKEKVGERQQIVVFTKQELRR